MLKWFNQDADDRAKLEARRHQLESYKIPPELEGQFTKSQVESFRLTFAAFDTDGEGSINFDEFKSVVALLAEKLSEDTITTMFRKADADCSGEIDFVEFVEAFNDSRHDGASSGAQDFVALAEKLEAKVQAQRQNSIARAFLIMTFLILVGSSSSVINYFKVIAIVWSHSQSHAGHY